MKPSFKEALVVAEALDNSVANNRPILLNPSESRILATVLVDLMASYGELVEILQGYKDKEIQQLLVESVKDVKPVEA